MKATHKDGEVPICHIRVQFVITSFHLEQAIIYMLTNNESITIRRIREWISYAFFSGGQQSLSSWNHIDDIETHRKKAEEVARKLFPTFYNS